MFALANVFLMCVILWWKSIFSNCAILQIMRTRAGQCHAGLFTARSLGDTWIKLIPNQKTPSPAESATLRIDVCNLRVDRDSTPGVRSVRKTKQISNTALILPPQSVLSVSAPRPRVVVMSPSLRSWRGITHSGEEGGKNSPGSSSALRIFFTRRLSGVEGGRKSGPERSHKAARPQETAKRVRRPRPVCTLFPSSCFLQLNHTQVHTS